MLHHTILPARAGRNVRILLSNSAAIALAMSLAMPVSAQVLEEITVTAQRREQNIQDVGISVAAFTGDQMRSLGINNSFDITAWVPNVNMSGALAGQNTQFSIRGVTQNDFNDIIESPVAVYIDEGYVAIAQANTFALFDIERVEIMKGPQSTLFGRNATGGVVQYISRQPSFDGLEATADVEYGVYDSPNDANRFRLEAAIGGPFSDTVAGRIAVLYNDREPYLDNLYLENPAGAPGQPERFGQGTLFAADNSFAANAPAPDAGADLGDIETTALRGILQWNPQDTLRFRLTGNWEDSDMGSSPYQSKPVTGVYNSSNPDPAVALSQGELVNSINTPPNDARRSICADGTDCGSDQDVNGFPDDFVNNATGAPGSDGITDVFRLNNQFAVTPGTDFFGYLDPDGEDWTFSGDFAFEDVGGTETSGLALRIEWDLGDRMTLTSITDWKDYEKLLNLDVDSAPVNQAVNYAGVDADSLTQEFRLNGTTDRTTWVAGFYFLNIDTVSQNGLKFPFNSLNFAIAPADVGVDAQLETDSYSLYGQIDWQFADNWTLIAGGRVVREEKDYHLEQNLYLGNPDPRLVHQGTPILIGPTFPGGVPTAFTDSTSDTLWAGKLQVDWRPNEDWLVYAGLNRGVKAGSFNAHLPGILFVPESAIPYDDETLHSLEAGFKWSISDRTRLNATAFYYDYSDYQAFLFIDVGGVVINSDATTVGAELELQTTPIDNLDILLSLGWIDAEVEDVPLRLGSTNTRNVDPVYAPEFQAAGMIRYAWSAFGGMMHIQADASYSDSFFYNLRNFDSDQFDSYTLVNAVLGWTSPEEHWGVSLAVRNITDEHAGIFGFNLATLCGCNEISFRPPTQAVARVVYSY